MNELNLFLKEEAIELIENYSIRVHKFMKERKKMWIIIPFSVN